MMLSSTDVESLITVKKREIEQEKMLLGLSPQLNDNIASNENISSKNEKNVKFSRPRAFSENDTALKLLEQDEVEPANAEADADTEAPISPELERYIRRYLGLPVMLKAGEFSPNNPLIRAERTSGDVLLGLGEYERRRNTLRKIRQKQYREYLDQQAKKKQEAKEKAEKERREREEKEGLEEERIRQRLELERERSPERRRASYTYVSPENNAYTTKVDMGVQVDYRSTPLSVAVQTDGELYVPNERVSNLLTQAERELSPHTAEPRDRQGHAWGQQWPDTWQDWAKERRRSYGDYERSSHEVGAGERAKLHTVPRYQPSILDADAIQLRNELAEKEAAERRQFYQRELRNQILEQQRIREERRCREKLLEQAEMRRLEEQLRSLKLAQESEVGRQHMIKEQMQDNASEFERKRNVLQKEIDAEQKVLARRGQRAGELGEGARARRGLADARPTYSTNIPDDSIFSPNYDVDSYLRRNLNPTKESLIHNTFKTQHGTDGRDRYEVGKIHQASEGNNCSKINKTVATLHEPLRDKGDGDHQNQRDQEDQRVQNNDTLQIPVLRHSPQVASVEEPQSELSEAMQIVDDKWRVPAVQRNILKSLPREGGKTVSILTQLGSIRRQLQMEQLKLDKMLSKNIRP